MPIVIYIIKFSTLQKAFYVRLITSSCYIYEYSIGYTAAVC